MGIGKQTVVWAGILAMLLLGPAGAAAATDEIQIVTTGVQSVTGKEISEARQAAVSDALTWSSSTPGFCRQPRIISAPSGY